MLISAPWLCGQNPAAVGASESRATVKHVTTSDGVDLYVEVKGTGTPCLYIHGGPGSGSYWMEKFSAGLLERHLRMVYLDQRGVARSTSPKDGNYSMDRMVEDFEEVRTALGIPRWLTMGHSIGGIMQMGYAKRHPDIVQGMIMLNCGYNLNELVNKTWILRACEMLGVKDTKPYTDESIPAMERVTRIRRELDQKGIAWKLSYASRKNKELMDATFDEVPNWNKDLERIALSIPDYWENYKPQTKDMRMPVLVFYGKTDWNVGPEHYTGLEFPRMMLWGSRVGHVAIMENRPDLEKAITSYLLKYDFLPAKKSIRSGAALMLSNRAVVAS
jgi:proline iminopeptidase